MSELVQCSGCQAYIYHEDSCRSPVLETIDVPDGYRPMYHLCCDCIVKYQARRNSTWGWLVKVRRPATPASPR